MIPTRLIAIWFLSFAVMAVISGSIMVGYAIGAASPHP